MNCVLLPLRKIKWKNGIVRLEQLIYFDLGSATRWVLPRMHMVAPEWAIAPILMSLTAGGFVTKCPI